LDSVAVQVLGTFRKYFQGNPYLITDIPSSAVARYYQLLDDGTTKAVGGAYAGNVAASTVAMEFGISTAELWKWISERATIQSMRRAA
jgi:hypothetical protein